MGWKWNAEETRATCNFGGTVGIVSRVEAADGVRMYASAEYINADDPRLIAAAAGKAPHTSFVGAAAEAEQLAGKVGDWVGRYDGLKAQHEALKASHKALEEALEAGKCNMRMKTTLVGGVAKPKKRRVA